MKHSIISNIDDQDRATKKNNGKVKQTYAFFEKPSDWEELEDWKIEDIL